MNDNTKTMRWLELLTLLVIFVVLGYILVPAHWTSIWMDYEFSGWVSPIANRLVSGQKLYTDGLHMPMPPLPFILTYLLSWGQASWFLESLLIFVFQCATLLLVYQTFSFIFRPPLPFLTTFMAIPIFFSLPKKIFYDPLPQFLVAAILFFMVLLLKTVDEQVNSKGRAYRPLWVVLMGFSTTILLLSKQSTGVGAFGGVLIAFCFMPWLLGWKMVGRLILIYLGSVVVSFLLFSLLLLPFVSISGMINDVFLTGSEPKGGFDRLRQNILLFPFKSIKEIPLSIFLVSFGMFLFAGRQEWLGQLNFFKSIKDNVVFPWRIKTFAIFIFVVVFILLGTWIHRDIGVITSIPPHSVKMLLWLGLLLWFYLIVQQLFSRIFKTKQIWSSAAILAPLGWVALLAAVFHNTSVDYVRLYYDNNPLILISLAILCFFIVSLPDKWSLKTKGGMAITPLLLFISLTVVCWQSVFPQVKLARACTEDWPGVEYLQGAYFRPSAVGMRNLVKEVRGLTSDKDQVLLLPNDPNVEEWFARPRPELSSAMLFADQYWDRYVDEDFDRIEKQLPKVIVIGPSDYWRLFSRLWHTNWGVERLIDRVKKELLPKHYKLYASQKILMGKKIRYMDVYVLNNE